MFKPINYIDDKQFKNASITNVRITPVKVETPKVIPVRDDKVALA